MATLAIRGNNERAEDIARLFKDLGAQGEYYPCSDESYLYYMAHDQTVISIKDQPDNIYRNLLFNVYTIEEFEAKFPYRVGDKVAYDEFYSPNSSAVEKVAHIKYMSWDCNHSDVRYTMEGCTIRRVYEIRKVETEFEPKDGDVCKIGPCIYIFKTTRQSSLRKYDYTVVYHCCYNERSNRLSVGKNIGVGSLNQNHRLANESEKKKLFDKLAEEGWEWRTDTKEFVKLKWKPKEGEYFYSPICSVLTCIFTTNGTMYNSGRDKSLLDNGWCFKNAEECEQFCRQLNQAIKGVKI